MRSVIAYGIPFPTLWLQTYNEIIVPIRSHEMTVGLITNNHNTVNKGLIAKVSIVNPCHQGVDYAPQHCDHFTAYWTRSSFLEKSYVLPWRSPVYTINVTHGRHIVETNSFAKENNIK